VIQSVGPCSTSEPFPISNTDSTCNLTVTSVTITGPNPGDFRFSGLPSFPVVLLPGHEVGEGNWNVVFAATQLARSRTATLEVTYVSDPVAGTTTTVTRTLSGEGVRTGARVLVTSGGVPRLKMVVVSGCTPPDWAAANLLAAVHVKGYPPRDSMQQRRQRTWWLKPLLIVAVLAAAAGLLRLTVLRPKPVPVTVHQVEKGRVEDTVVNSRAGTVESRRRSEISPGIPGLVVEIPARKGMRVKQGDVLLRLNDHEYKAQAELAQRALDAARAVADQARLETENAQRQWKRTQELALHQVESDTAIDLDRTRALTAQAGLVAAQARIQEAAASLEVARATLEKTIITAPFDGVVLDVTTEVGEWISPSPPGVPLPPVLDLIDPQAIYVGAPIDEADVARLQTALPVRITLDAFRGRSFRGKVTYISSFVETRREQNRTLRVEAEFEEAQLPPNLLPGLSADVEIILDACESVLRIPTYALLENGRVLIVQNDQLAERKVTTGLHNWSFTEIRSGLSAGDSVVVSLDRPEVKAGARVKVTGEAQK